MSKLVVINNVKPGLTCHICTVPASFIVRLGHQEIKAVYTNKGEMVDDLSEGYGEDFPYCRACFNSVKEAVYRG